MHDLLAIAQALAMFWEQKLKLKKNDRHTKKKTTRSYRNGKSSHLFFHNRGKDSEWNKFLIHWLLGSNASNALHTVHHLK